MGQKHTRDSGNSMSAIPPIVRNIYICPGGAQLTSTGNIDQGHIVYYRASKSDCSQCSLKPKCTIATARKITATSTKMCEIVSAPWPIRKPSSSPAASARRSRCDLRT